MTAERQRAIAERIRRLGTETAFAVSAEAAALAGQGHTVYPFHLGDMNLPDAGEHRRGHRQRAIAGRQDRLLPQRRHPAAARGAGRRRQRLARARTTRWTTSPSSRAASPSSASSSWPLMNPGDEVLYPNPGYPIYEIADRVPRRHAPCRTATARARTTSRSTWTRSSGSSRRARGCSSSTTSRTPPAPRLAGGTRARGGARAPARPARAVRRGVLRHPLQRHQPLARLAAGHGGAHPDPLHLQQEVRHDRLAARRGRRAQARSST